MKLQVIGIERKTGSYTNPDSKQTYNYDNFILHSVGKNMDVTGQCVREVKLKAAAAAELIADCGGDPAKIVGHTVDFDFGSYGKVTNYELVK